MRRRYLPAAEDRPACAPILALLQIRRPRLLSHFLAQPALVIDEAYIDETGATPLLQAAVRSAPVGSDSGALECLRELLKSPHAAELQVRTPAPAATSPVCLGRRMRSHLHSTVSLICSCQVQHVPLRVTAHADLGGCVFEGATPVAAAILHALADDPAGANLFTAAAQPAVRLGPMAARQEMVAALLEHERASAAFVEVGPMVRFGDHKEHLLALTAYLCHALPLHGVLLVRTRPRCALAAGVAAGKDSYARAGRHARLQLPQARQHLHAARIRHAARALEHARRVSRPGGARGGGYANRGRRPRMQAGATAALLL